MKFITRSLYESIQPGSGVEKSVAGSAWASQTSAYQAYLRGIKYDLPISMCRFCGTTLRDGIIKKAVFVQPDTVEFSIDGRNCSLVPPGQFQLRFSGVRKVEGLEQIVSDEWLYEEVHLHPEAGFDYRVLLAKSELCVVADKIDFEVVSQ